MWRGGKSTGTSLRNLKTGDATADMVKRNGIQLNGSGGPRRMSCEVVSRRSAARIRSKDQSTPAHIPDIALSDCLGTWSLTILAPIATTPRQTSRQRSVGLGRESAHCPWIRNESWRGQLEASDHLSSGQARPDALKLSSSASSNRRTHWLPRFPWLSPERLVEQPKTFGVPTHPGQINIGSVCLFRGP